MKTREIKGLQELRPGPQAASGSITSDSSMVSTYMIIAIIITTAATMIRQS